MPEPCDCPVNKNFDESKRPNKCSCPAGTHNTVTENQQGINESASSSNKPSNVVTNQRNMSQAGQNKNVNGPNLSQSNQNGNDTSNQPGLLGSTGQNNENGRPAVTDPWENCKCNFPEISPICKCSEAEDDVSGDKEVKHPRMAATKDNSPLDEDKNDASIRNVEISTKDISPDSVKPGEGDKTEDDVPPETNLSSKTAEDQSINVDGKKKIEEKDSPDTGSSKPTVGRSPLTQHKGSSTDENIEFEAQPDTKLASKGDTSSKDKTEGDIRPDPGLSSKESLGENKGDTSSKDKTEGDIPPESGLSSKATEEQSSLGAPRTHPVEGDVPPDEGEIKEFKDLSKFICTCEKDKQASNKTNQNLDTNPANCERTFIMVKPDGVQRGLVGKIIKKFEQKGFHLVALSFLWPSEELLTKHYAELSDRPFFPGLIQYMSSGPVVPMVWEGLGIVKTGRSLLGATNPADSAAGTIRGDLCIQVGRNICHASDSIDSANNEIDLWFSEKELIPWAPANQTWVYED